MPPTLLERNLPATLKRWMVFEDIFRSLRTWEFFNHGFIGSGFFGLSISFKSFISSSLNCWRSSFVTTSIAILHSFRCKNLQSRKPVFASGIELNVLNRRPFSTRCPFFWTIHIICGLLLYFLFFVVF
jgi:hypothetical protein